jgi:hypothetical protein
MKLLLIPALLLAAAGPAVRFEADGVRVGSELVTGTAVSLKESGALPLLVSGSVVESLSGETLSVSLGDKQVELGSGLRLARVADGYRLSTHGMPFTLAAGDVTLTSDHAASFKVTDKGFDFGALGTLNGSSFTAKALATKTPAAALTAPAQEKVSPERSGAQVRLRIFRRVFETDPLNAANAAGSPAVLMIPRVTPDGAP